ncbi:RES domain-containing protein [Blastococcus aurantiacus]|uniref:RES domain-containing protein n=1 Tax=Blastococcus aurantiacus TaxID=1550231 RepID=A0A1G7J3V1_9ACTN|nr:RES family NAD+ phosphorylase [Blastococcus aurantiacus]SDF19600.1 RES domain-containing protein [Blastococcus aurantiacus]
MSTSSHDPELLDALEELATNPYEGTAWRHMFNDYPPSKVNISGARWNPAGVGAIYLAVDRDTAEAEGQHAVDIQPARMFARRVLYEVNIDVDDVVDLTAVGALRSVGLSSRDIEADDFTNCQKVGAAAAWLGRGGLLVPSARAAGSNLVVLVDSSAAATDVTIVSTQVLETR